MPQSICLRNDAASPTCSYNSPQTYHAPVGTILRHESPFAFLWTKYQLQETGHITREGGGHVIFREIHGSRYNTIKPKHSNYPIQIQPIPPTQCYASTTLIYFLHLQLTYYSFTFHWKLCPSFAARAFTCFRLSSMSFTSSVTPTHDYAQPHCLTFYPCAV